MLYLSQAGGGNKAVSGIANLVLRIVAADLIKEQQWPHQARPESAAGGAAKGVPSHAGLLSDPVNLSPEVPSDSFHSFMTLGCHPSSK